MQKFSTVTTNSSPWFGRTRATFFGTIWCWVCGFNISWRTARLKAGGYALDIHWANGSVDKIVDVHSETAAKTRGTSSTLGPLESIPGEINYYIKR